ncbi:MAG: hypothetical protein ACYC4R_07180 [Anaerolineae bacterium]
MKKTVAVLVTLLSVPFLLLGLLFLIAAAQQPNRLLVALVLLAAGVVLLVAGLRRLRKLAAVSPEALRTSAIDLARRLGGELTVPQLRAEYGVTQEQAAGALEELVAQGNARREQREDRIVYVFSGLLPSLAEKVCPYCGTKLPVRAALRKCPNCGAQLEIKKS